MTSQINYSAINESYPVAGQDNNSQGFRDNFAAISAGLAQAATEISALQTNGIDVTQSTNNLLSSTLYNGLYAQFYPEAIPLGTINSPLTIDVSQGSVQYGEINATALTLTFDKWPDTGAYGNVKLILKFSQTSTTTTTLSTTNSGKLIVDNSWTGSVFQQAGGVGTNVQIVYPNPGNNVMYVIDAFSYDGGVNVFLKVSGTYTGVV
jgi:hypothetical protein